MGSKALLMLKGVSFIAPKNQIFNFNRKSSFSKVVVNHNNNSKVRSCSTNTTQSSLEPPDLPRLAETARISLTPNEVEEFAPKIGQVIDWFGQLQDVDLHSIEPAIRADTEDNNLRDDIPETFENRESMIAAVPSYEEPYIKVPKVLNKE
ncbi:glutamyl-tRNA(Gln) amidotransferase subunit C, chloroplastic/mitochondrial isoform X2 [Fagus crenata]